MADFAENRTELLLAVVHGVLEDLIAAIVRCSEIAIANAHYAAQPVEDRFDHLYWNEIGLDFTSAKDTGGKIIWQAYLFYVC